MDKKFLITRKGLTLRLSIVESRSLTTVGTLSEEQAAAVDAWVEETKTGIRLAWDMWKMNDEQSVSLFMLKWQS